MEQAETEKAETFPLEGNHRPAALKLRGFGDVSPQLRCIPSDKDGDVSLSPSNPKSACVVKFESEVINSIPLGS